MVQYGFDLSIDDWTKGTNKIKNSQYLFELRPVRLNLQLSLSKLNS